MEDESEDTIELGSVVKVSSKLKRVEKMRKEGISLARATSVAPGKKQLVPRNANERLWMVTLTTEEAQDDEVMLIWRTCVVEAETRQVGFRQEMFSARPILGRHVIDRNASIAHCMISVYMNNIVGNIQASLPHQQRAIEEEKDEAELDNESVTDETIK